MSDLIERLHNCIDGRCETNTDIFRGMLTEAANRIQVRERVMSDLATDPIREVIEILRKERENKSDPMRSILGQLIFSTLATRLEQQADEIERLTAECHKYHVNINGMQTVIDDQAKRIADLEAALQEISEGNGRYSMDQLEHADNTIEDMIGLAQQALAKGERHE